MGAATPQARRMCVVFVCADEWIKVLEDPKMWDQTAFNDLARRGHGSSEQPKNLFKVCPVPCGVGGAVGGACSVHAVHGCSAWLHSCRAVLRLYDA